MNFYYAYDIFGYGNWGYDDFVRAEFSNKSAAEQDVETMAADEWCDYGGLHGIGFGEDEIDEYREEGLSDEEIHAEEWEQARNSVAYVVFTEEEFINWLKSEGYDNEEIQKILLDLQPEA